MNATPSGTDPGHRPVDQADPASAAVGSPDGWNLDGLVDPGFVILDGFLSTGEVAALRGRIDALDRDGRLFSAGVGRGEARRFLPAVRGDRIAWIESGEAPERDLAARIDTLRNALNERFWMGLEDFEMHFAWYAPGRGYARHRDRFRDDDRRRVSLVVYLNDADWDPGHDGGELRVFSHGRAPSADVGQQQIETELDIAPLAGRAVLFLSECTEHEVRPASRDRFSVACWFRVRPVGRRG